MSAKAAIKPVAERELTITRIFDAPRELVFRMWTDPVHMAQWWGPRSFTNPVCELDARPGGAILIHMRAPNGNIFPMGGEFREIVSPERIVFTTFVDGPDGRILEGHNVVTFEDSGGKTKLTVQARAAGFVELAKQMLAGMEAGWTQSLDKLEELVDGARGRATAE
jgi:uncharacterized protein YndB with AHSA1/START domain